MRELENRIVFQMNSSDSSNLIDSPAAARLGPHRALLYREESGTSEKFRPYHAPEPGWLQSLAAGTSRTSATPPPAAPPEPAGDDLSVAKELSEDPGSAKSGESYEATPTAGLVPPFKNLSLRLNKGEVGVVKTQFGVHIIKRVE